MLDGIPDKETELPIAKHTSDTAGYTDLIFSVFDLLGLQFSPRLRDLGDQKLYRIVSSSSIRYQNIGRLVRRTLKTQLILDHWGDMLHVAGSLKLAGLPLPSLLPSFSLFGTETCGRGGRRFPEFVRWRSRGREDNFARVGQDRWHGVGVAEGQCILSIILKNRGEEDGEP